MRLSLQLDEVAHISYKGFETLNWLPATERFNQCNDPIVFKYINDECFSYLNEVFNIKTRGSFRKLKYPFCKTNAGQMALSFIGSIIRSKTWLVGSLG